MSHTAEMKCTHTISTRVPIILFLGSVRIGEYEWFVKNNVQIGVIIDTNNVTKTADLSVFEFVEKYDFKKEISGLFDIIDRLIQKYTISCILNMREFYVTHLATICKKYSFKGLSEIAAENCLNKKKMRDVFLQKIDSSHTAHYCQVNTIEDIYCFAKERGFPIIIKPSNLHSSIFVDVIQKKDDIKPIYTKIKQGISQYYKKSIMKTDKINVQVEEYLSGSTHSIDSLVDNQGFVYTTPIVDVVTARDIHIQDFHHYARITPTALNETQQNESYQLATQAIQALGIKNSLAHMEFINTVEGPKLLEVGARPGGNRAHLLRQAYGIEFIAAYAKALRGMDFYHDLQPRWEKSFAFITPFSAKKGIFKKYCHLEQLEQLDSFYSLRNYAKPGIEIGLAKEGYMSVLFIELFSESKNRILSDIDNITQKNDLFILDKDIA